jgi:hypothetical protein
MAEPEYVAAGHVAGGFGISEVVGSNGKTTIISIVGAEIRSRGHSGKNRLQRRAFLKKCNC